MTAYNPPSFYIPNWFNAIFFTSTNSDNYLTYPVSQNIDETFLGSITTQKNLTVLGTSNLNNTLTLGTPTTYSTIKLNSGGGTQSTISTSASGVLTIKSDSSGFIRIGDALSLGSSIYGKTSIGSINFYDDMLSMVTGSTDELGNIK